jgi:hypothetical protein
MNYTPEKWVIIKIQKPDKTTYKVLGMWRGGYLDGDSWRLNSGIKSVEKTKKHFEVHGHSGSVYICGRNGYALTGYGATVARGLEGQSTEEVKISVLSEDEAWDYLNELA